MIVYWFEQSCELLFGTLSNLGQIFYLKLNTTTKMKFGENLLNFLQTDV